MCVTTGISRFSWSMFGFPVQTYGRYSSGRIFNIKVRIKNLKSFLSYATLHAHIKIISPSIAQSSNNCFFFYLVFKFFCTWCVIFLVLVGNKQANTLSRKKIVRKSPHSICMYPLEKPHPSSTHCKKVSVIIGLMRKKIEKILPGIWTWDQVRSLQLYMVSGHHSNTFSSISPQIVLKPDCWITRITAMPVKKKQQKTKHGCLVHVRERDVLVTGE